METIVLDANVLHSNTLRGLFLWMSKSKLLHPIWSLQIWDEVFRNHSDDEDENRKFKVTIETIILSRFPDSMRKLRNDYERIGLPDPDDEHIVALARQEKAPTVVTFNLKDFPAEKVQAVGVTCIHPDKFLCALYEAKPELMNTAILAHLQNLSRTKPTKAMFIEGFRKADLPKFSAWLTKEDSANNLFPEVWV